MKSMIGGCGCLMMAAAIALVSFILGAKYGEVTKKRLLETSTELVDETKKKLDKLNEQVKNVQEVAEAFTGNGGKDKNPPPASPGEPVVMDKKKNTEQKPATPKAEKKTGEENFF